MAHTMPLAAAGTSTISAIGYPVGAELHVGWKALTAWTILSLVMMTFGFIRLRIGSRANRRLRRARISPD